MIFWLLIDIRPITWF